MDNAREMTLLAKKLTDQNKGQQQGEEANQLQREMTLLGIGSPVSRDQISDPDIYERELSRQVYDYLMQAHYSTNTPISLIDLYCLYNRARGTDLILAAGRLGHSAAHRVNKSNMREVDHAIRGTLSVLTLREPRVGDGIGNWVLPIARGL